MVQFLLDLGADATSFAGDGKTPLEVGAGGRGFSGGWEVSRFEATWNPTQACLKGMDGSLVLSNMFFLCKDLGTIIQLKQPLEKWGLVINGG